MDLESALTVNIYNEAITLYDTSLQFVGFFFSLSFLIVLLLLQTLYRIPAVGSSTSKITMTGKAKPKKHTAKEIAMKVDAATTNRGGGKAGMADRTGREKGGHAKYECPLCKVTAPDIKSMQIHHDARHPKLPFDEASLVNLHAARVDAESSKPKPGIRGSLKK